MVSFMPTHLGSFRLYKAGKLPGLPVAVLYCVQSAAHVLGVRVLVLNGGTESEIAAAFATLVEQRVSTLLISADTFFSAARHQIMLLAARYAIPTMFFDRAAVIAVSATRPILTNAVVPRHFGP
jgi:Periplasmic binding proteins and sugar binding domain of LacI family